MVDNNGVNFMFLSCFCDDFEEYFTIFGSNLPIEIPALLACFIRRKLVRNKNYFEALIPQYQLDEFKSHFRLERRTFESLVTVVVQTGFLPLGNRSRRPIIHPAKQVLVALWMLATPECHRSVAYRFNITMSSVHRCLHRICKALVSVRRDFICWPQGAKATEIEQGFEEIRGFPHVLGAIDGTHIRIRTPSDYPDSYLNRKRSHSVILQAVCDHNLTFTDIHAGWPGSVHYSRVLANSPLHAESMQNHHVLYPGDAHLIGDSGYALFRWLMVPYRDNGHLSAAQKTYSFKLSSTRQVIERAFGLLKGRWRKLFYLDMLCQKKIVSVIVAACVLHNFCLMSGENYEEFLDDANRLDNAGDDINHDNVNNQVAGVKRDALRDYLSL